MERTNLINRASAGRAVSRTRKASLGFTLVELMIAVAIIGILSAIALPLYQNYIRTSREGVLLYNVSTIEMFQQDQRLRAGTFLTDADDLAEITAAIGWSPEEDNGIEYSIAAGPNGGYDVTAIDATGVTICVRFPGKIRCP